MAGEAPEDLWRRNFEKSLGDVRVTRAIDPALGYLTELRNATRPVLARIRDHLRRWLNRGGKSFVWAHNQSLGRNLLLTQELSRASEEFHFPLLLHHHDWWFDNRWARWPEMQRHGFWTLTKVARTLFPAHAKVWHATINRADATILQRHLGSTTAWLPNPSASEVRAASSRIRKTQSWIHRELGEHAPIWLVPCRLLRRKNLAEALLLARWLRPEAWLVTTAGVSSAAEQSYARKLEFAARQNGWRLRLGVLDGKSKAPSIPELMETSEVVLLTSIVEGFGLPYVEAAAARRPFIARMLPNMASDLNEFGFRFPQIYDEVFVDPMLFDWPAERRRQTERFRRWRSELPKSAQQQVRFPSVLTTSCGFPAVAFSRLTLLAQLEILRQPVELSWERSVHLNPSLARWRSQASEGHLQPTRWPKQANRWLSVDAYARRLAELISRPKSNVQQSHGEHCHRDLVASKLRPEYLYPLLWTVEP